MKRCILIMALVVLGFYLGGCTRVEVCDETINGQWIDFKIVDHIYVSGTAVCIEWVDPRMDDTWVWGPGPLDWRIKRAFRKYECMKRCAEENP